MIAGALLAIAALSPHHYDLAFQTLMFDWNTEHCHFVFVFAVRLLQAFLTMILRYSMFDACNNYLAHLSMQWCCKDHQICQVLTISWTLIVNSPIYCR
jgi:hypothetical protein